MKTLNLQLVLLVREGLMSTWVLMFLAEIPLVVGSGMYVNTLQLF